jgi:hypothetical protein
VQRRDARDLREPAGREAGEGEFRVRHAAREPPRRPQALRPPRRQPELLEHLAARGVDDVLDEQVLALFDDHLVLGHGLAHVRARRGGIDRARRCGRRVIRRRDGNNWRRRDQCRDAAQRFPPMNAALLRRLPPMNAALLRRQRVASDRC